MRQECGDSCREEHLHRDFTEAAWSTSDDHQHRSHFTREGEHIDTDHFTEETRRLRDWALEEADQAHARAVSAERTLFEAKQRIAE